MNLATTIVISLAFVVIWVLRRVEKKNVEAASEVAKKKIKRSKEPTTTTLKIEDEDITKRHLHGVLEEMVEPLEEEVLPSVDRIEKLSRLKKAIVWSEILDKPVSERYNAF